MLCLATEGCDTSCDLGTTSSSYITYLFCRSGSKSLGLSFFLTTTIAYVDDNSSLLQAATNTLQEEIITDEEARGCL